MVLRRDYWKIAARIQAKVANFGWSLPFLVPIEATFCLKTWNSDIRKNEPDYEDFHSLVWPNITEFCTVQGQDIPHHHILGCFFFVCLSVLYVSYSYWVEDVPEWPAGKLRASFKTSLYARLAASL